MPSIKSIANKAKNKGGLKDLLSSNLTRLKISSFTDPGYKTPNSKGKEYEVQFNPTRIDEAIKLEYVDGDQVQGSTNSPKKFKHAKPSELKLTLTLDGTGVQAAAGSKREFGLSGSALDVSAEIEKFKAVTCNYIGNTHDVPFLRIKWGDLTFEGRLQSLNISHVLFKSDGKPLRSILDVTFATAIDLKTQALEAKKASPDLTHIRTVKVGDTLPLMCKEIYNDPGYYLKIAKFNNIVDFRNLELGTEIIFPPVV